MRRVIFLFGMFLPVLAGAQDVVRPSVTAGALSNSPLIASTAFRLVAAVAFRRHRLRPVGAVGYTICQVVLSSRIRSSFPAMMSSRV